MCVGGGGCSLDCDFKFISPSCISCFLTVYHGYVSCNEQCSPVETWHIRKSIVIIIITYTIIEYNFV